MFQRLKTRMGTTVRTMITALLACLAVSTPLQAAETEPMIDKPNGPVVLTISGKIEHTNTAKTAEFDMATLMSMPSTRISTKTPWTEGVVTFDGVSVKALLNRVGAQGDIGEFIALNDYTVRIDLDDLIENGAIIAYLKNGRRMNIREKGPLWVIYPLDSKPALQTPVYRDRMVWQLRSILVK